MGLFRRQGLFVNGRGKTVNLKPMRRRALRYCQTKGNRLAIVNGQISNTTLWYWILATDWETRPNRDLDGAELLSSMPQDHSPWRDVLRALKPNRENPRVLISGTGSELESIPENPLESEMVQKLLEKHQLKSVSWSFCSHTESFWERFLGQKYWLDDAKDVPALVISSGNIRDHMSGMGHQIGIAPTLLHITSCWGIPLEIVAM